MEKAGEIIKRIISKRRWEQKFGIEYLKSKWKECVGAPIASHTSPSFISKKKLYIDVDSPVWANQLNFLQEEIIKKINEFFNKEVVKEIFFKTRPYIKKV